MCYVFVTFVFGSFSMRKEYVVESREEIMSGEKNETVKRGNTSAKQYERNRE